MVQNLKVISRKDQRQYWIGEENHYHYISMLEFTKAFGEFYIGNVIQCEFSTPFDRSKNHPVALVTSKYGDDKRELFKACFLRELKLMKRNAYFSIFKLIQVSMI